MCLKGASEKPMNVEKKANRNDKITTQENFDKP